MSEEVLCRLQWEVQDLVPSGHSAFVDVRSLQDGVLSMVLDFNFDVGFDLGSVVQLLFCAVGTIAATIVFDSLLPIKFWIIWVAWQVWRRSAQVASATIALAIFALESLILVNDLMPNWHILSLDDVHNDLAVLDKFDILRWLLLDQRLQLTATHEELVAQRDQEVCIV